MNVNKSEIAAVLVSLGLVKSKAAGERITDAVFAQIAEALSSGKSIRIPNVGSLRVVDKPARNRRNPRTGESFVQAAHKKAIFSQSKALKEALNG